VTGIKSFEVIVPKIAQEVFGLVLEFGLGEFGFEARTIIGDGKVRWDIDVDDAKVC
jgi:hypothetical protein